MDIAYYVNSAESRVARLPAAMGFARRNRPGNPSPPLASYPSNPSYSSYYDNTYYPNRQQHQVRNRKTPFRMECERELEGVESECRHGQESEETMTGSVMKTVPHAGASLDGSPHTTTRTIDQIPTTTTSPSTSTTPALGALDDQYTLSSNPPNPKNSFRYGDWICRVNGCSAHNFGRNVVCIGCGYPKAKSQLPTSLNTTTSTPTLNNIPSFTHPAVMNDLLSLDEKENLVGETISITNPNSGLNTSSNASIQRQQALARLQRLSITPPSSSSHSTTSSPSAAHSLSLSPSFLPTHSPRFQTQTQGNASLSPLYASQFNLNSASNYSADGLGLGGKRVSPLPSPLPSPSPSASALTSTFGAARQGGGGQYLSPLPTLPLGLPPSSPSHSLHLHNHHQQRLPSSHPTSPLPYSAPSYTSSSTSSTSASTTTTPLLTPSGRAFARGGRVQNVSRNPLVPCVIWWPDNEEWPLEGQIRPPLNLHHAPPTNTTQSNDVNGGVAPLAGNLPPILNTGNKGPIVNQPGDWICGVCGYLNWRRRKVCQVCLPYAEGNGDSISAAVQAERMALLTEVLMNAKNQIELDSQGSQRAGHSLSQQPQSQQLQGYSRSSQFEQGGQQRQHSLPLPHQLQVQPNQQRYQREGQSMSQPTSPLPFANPNTYAQFQATSNAGLGLGSNVSPSFALSTKHQQQQMGGAGVGVIGGGFAPANRPLPTAIGNGAGNGAGIASATSALLAPIYQTSPPRQREKADIEGDADGEDMLLPSFLQTLVRSPASSSSHSLSSPPSSSHSHSSPPSSASTSPSPNGDDHEGTLSSTPTTPFTHSFGYSHPSLHGYPYAYSSPSPSSTSHSNSHSTFVSPMSSKPTSVGSSPDLGCHSQAEKLTLVGGGASGVGVIGRGRVRNPSAESTSTSSSISESEESEGFSSNASVVSSASSATTTTSNSHSHPHSHSNGKSKSHSPSPLRNTNSSTSVSGGSIWQIGAEEHHLSLGPLGGVGGSFGGMGSAGASRVGSRKSSFERLQAQLGGMSISGGL